jgi:predicted PurR-regulated permease PerM
MQPHQRDLAQNTLGVLFIGGLIAATFWVLRPFIPAVIWATTVVVATWPFMRQVEARLWGRRSLAVAVMTLLLLAILIVPLGLAILTIADNREIIAGWAQWLMEAKVPPPPDWVAGLPLVGAKLLEIWQEYAAAGIQDFAARLAPYADRVTQWFISEAGTVGMIFLQLLLIVLISALMYAGGESAAAWLRLFGKRLAGQRGENMVVLAGQAIRGVAMGVVVTALVQSVLGGIGLAIAGVPMAAVLTALMFMLCIAQLGPVLVLAPAVVWVFWSGDSAWGTFLLVWTIVVTSLDNILRPYLIKKGADLPLLLIFAGVIGGMITLGLVGIFVGPVVLAVTYTLVDEWVEGSGSGVVAPVIKRERTALRIPPRASRGLPRRKL